MCENMVMVVSEAFSWSYSVKKLSAKFGKIHGKTPVIEFCSSNVVGKCEYLLRKSALLQAFHCEFCQIL